MIDYAVRECRVTQDQNSVTDSGFTVTDHSETVCDGMMHNLHKYAERTTVVLTATHCKRKKI